MQRVASNLADVTIPFLTLMKSEELGTFDKFVGKRFENCITPAHTLLSIPKYMGAGLNNDQEETAR